MSRVIYDISVTVTGIKKRCRKADRHNFDVAEIDFKELSSEDVNEYLNKAKDVLKANMKESQRAILQFRRVTLENLEAGIVSRQTMYPDPAHKSFNIEL